jgi:hypothetical protein
MRERTVGIVGLLGAGLAGCGLILGAAAGTARGDVITQWTFNSTGPVVDNDPTTGTLTPETGAGTLATIGGVSDSGFAQGAGDDTSPTIGSNNNSSFETQGYPPFDSGNKTAGIEIAASTVGYQDIGLSFAHNQFGGASASFRIQYSTNGTTFTDAAGYTGSSAGTFVLRSDDFSAIPGLDDNPNARFRVVAEFQGFFYSGLGESYKPNARNRFDWVTVTGTPVPEPTATGVTALALAAMARRVRRR